MKAVDTRELVHFLKAHLDKDLGFINKLKCLCRSYVCPFDDLLNFIPENQHVLDIGCGAGTFLQIIAEYRSPRSLAGLETNPVLIVHARSGLQRYSEIPLQLEVYDG
ncbi:MAG: methionine biosynthesis protein MetW, partial [Nitrospiraceae bacterium]